MLTTTRPRLLISALLFPKSALTTLLLSLTCSSFLIAQFPINRVASGKTESSVILSDFKKEDQYKPAQRLSALREDKPIHSDRYNIRKLKLKLIPGNISFRLGGNYQMPTGTYVKWFKKDISANVDANEVNSSINGKITPIVSFIAGTGSNWQISKKFLLSSGLQFTHQGYKLELNSIYSDPRYQYDESIFFKQNIKTSILVVPLSGIFQISEKDNLEFGIMLGAILKNSMKVSSSFEDLVFINGEKDQDESTGKTEIDLDYKENSKALTQGMFCSYFRNLINNFYAGVSAHYSGKYLSFQNGNVANLGFTLYLKYDIQL